MACWIVTLEGGPEGANHASVAIGHLIYAIGSCVCSGDSSTSESDESDESDEYNESFGVHVLNTTNYRWRRVITRIFQSEESIDESERSFQPYGEIPTFREGHTVVAYDGMVYMWGGYCMETRTLCSKMYCFDPENKTWSVIPSRSETPPGRVRHTAVVYKNMMLIYGGQDDIRTTISDDVWAYNFDTRKWYEVIINGRSPPGREHHTACVIKEKMYIFGGINGTDGELGMDILNLETGFWETPEITGEIPDAVREPCCWVHNDKMYVFGGCRQRDSLHTSDLHRFDPERSIWHRMHPFGLHGPTGRQRHCGVIVEDRVFLFSGVISLIPYELNTDIGYILEICDLHVLNLNWTLKDLASLVVLHELFEIDFRSIPFDLDFDLRMMVTPNDTM